MCSCPTMVNSAVLPKTTSLCGSMIVITQMSSPVQWHRRILPSGRGPGTAGTVPLAAATVWLCGATEPGTATGQTVQYKNQTEERAKVVAAGWWTELIQFHAARALGCFDAKDE